MKPHFTQLFSLLLVQGELAKLAEALVKAERPMTESGERQLWLYWKVQSLSAEGLMDDARDLAATILDPAIALDLMILIEGRVADISKDYTALVALLQKKLESGSDPIAFLALCEVLYQKEEWQELAAKAKELTQKVRTVPALKLAVEGAFRADDIVLCIELLTDAESLFPRASLPVDLRRLRLECLRRLGHPQVAAREAESLAKETREPMDLLTLVSMRLQSADIKGATVLARELLERNDIPAEEHLRLAQILQIDDQASAIEHFDRALTLGDDSPHFLASALNLAFKLGREEAVAKLWGGLEQLVTTEGPIRLVNLESLVEHQKDYRDSVDQILPLYEKGRIPLHLFLERIDGTLSQFIHWRFRQGFDPGVLGRAMPILARSGAPRTSVEIVQSGKIVLDISAIIIANEVGFLDLVEGFFEVLYIPSSLVSTLINEIQETYAHQPSKIDEAQAVLELVREGKVGVPELGKDFSAGHDPLRPAKDWLQLLRVVQSLNGFLVDYLPKTVGIPARPALLSELESAAVIDCGSVFNALRCNGRLSKEQVEFAENNLASYANSSVVMEIKQGATLCLYGNIAELLAGAGILQAAARYFNLLLDPIEKERLELQLEQAAVAAQLRGTLKSLLTRIQRGLGQKWRLLPEKSDDDENLSSKGYERCLVELLNAKLDEELLVWIDDRLMNSYSKVNTNACTSSYDILVALRGAKKFSDDEFFSILHRMRAANVRFLPITAEEILYQLKRTTTSEEGIVETPELRVLRAYCAYCISEGRYLQLPPMEADQPNQNGDVDYLVGLTLESRRAIGTLWKDVDIDKISETALRSDWILENFVVEITGLPIANERALAQPGAILESYSSSLAQYYTHGMFISRAGKAGNSKRAQYFAWLRRRFNFSSSVLEALGTQFEWFFSNERLSTGEDATEENLRKNLFAQFFNDLPEEVKLHIDLAKIEGGILSVKENKVTKISGWRFNSDFFWDAVDESLKSGRPCDIRSLEGQALTITCSRKDTGYALHIVDCATGVESLLSDSAFRLFDSDVKSRRDFLLADPSWTDLLGEEREALSTQVALEHSLSKRISLFNDSRVQSASFLYANLRTKLQESVSLSVSDFIPPRLEAVLRYSGSAKIDWAQPKNEFGAVAKSLVAQFGFVEAFDRIASVPTPLPEALLESFLTLEPSKRDEWLEGVLNVPVNLVAKIYAIRLLALRDSERAIEEVEKLSAPEFQRSWAIFLALLLRTMDVFNSREPNAQAQEKLFGAWVHTATIFGIASKDSSEDLLLRVLSQWEGIAGELAFDQQGKLQTDVCHPRNIRLREFLLHSTIYIFQDVQLSVSNLARLSSQFQRLCFISDDSIKGRLPHPELLCPPEWRGDCLGSFLSENRMKELTRYLDDDAALLSNQLTHHLVRSAIEGLLKTKLSDVGYWDVVVNALARAETPAALQKEIMSLLESEDLAQAFGGIELSNVSIFLVVAHLGSQNVEAVPKLVAQLVASAEGMHFSAEEHRQKDEAAGFFVNFLYALSSFEPQSSKAAQFFGESLSTIVVKCPELGSPVWRFLKRLLMRLSPEVINSMWPLILQLRKSSV